MFLAKQYKITAASQQKNVSYQGNIFTVLFLHYNELKSSVQIFILIA